MRSDKNSGGQLRLVLAVVQCATLCGSLDVSLTVVLFRLLLNLKSHFIIKVVKVKVVAHKEMQITDVLL